MHITELCNIIAGLDLRREYRLAQRLFYLGHDGTRLVEMDTSYITEAMHEHESCDHILNLVGSINGLVCLKVYFYRDFNCVADELVIWNPATREFKRLPTPTPQRLQLVGYWFGLDKETSEYKVVRFGTEDERARHGTSFQLFTESSGRWRQLRRFPMLRIFRCNGAGLELDGKIHWAIRCDPLVPKGPFRVLSFDLCSGEFVESVGPAWPGYEDPHHVKLVKWKGSLGAILVKQYEIDDQFWFRIANNGGDSWRKIDVDPAFCPSRYNGNGIVRDQLILNKKGKTLLYNLSTHETREVEDDFANVYLLQISEEHRHTLLSPHEAL